MPTPLQIDFPPTGPRSAGSASVLGDPVGVDELMPAIADAPLG